MDRFVVHGIFRKQVQPHSNLSTIFLDEGNRNWTIVGGNIGLDVIDNGENSLITVMNVNISDIPPGQAIVDNLRNIIELLHDLEDQ